MSQTNSKIRLSAAIAARSALITTVTVLVLVGLRAVLNMAFGQNQHVDWRLALGLAGIFGLGTFLFLFLRACITRQRSGRRNPLTGDGCS